MRSYLIFATLISNVLTWNIRNYPNPQQDFNQCGNQQQSQICDPDSILSSQDRISLNRMVAEILRGSSASGGTQADRCAQKGITISIALLNQLDTDSGIKATEKDLSNFADNLVNTWRPDPQCEKSAVIALAKNDRTIWIAKGNNLKHVISKEDSLLVSRTP